MKEIVNALFVWLSLQNMILKNSLLINKFSFYYLNIMFKLLISILYYKVLKCNLFWNLAYYNIYNDSPDTILTNFNIDFK